jgi:glycosyltransferase involved in cell wall biosynthesis
MPEVIIIQRIFAEYRKSIFDELHKDIDFILLHSKQKSEIAQVTTPYSIKIKSFRYSRNQNSYFINVFPYIMKNKPKIIIHEFSLHIASLIPTYFLSKLLRIKFVLWGHGYDLNKGFHPEKKFTDKLRLFLVKKSDAVIFYGQEAKLKISKYADNKKLFVAYNCLNTNFLSVIRDKLELEGRENVKRRLGFTHEFNLLFIGRILKTKRPELLIDIYEYLMKKYYNSLCIHFIGDGPYLNKLKEIVQIKKIENNIKFYGAIHDDIRNGEILYCSDLMVMPGYVGLSVNHAFNFDCPVVTFQQKENGPFHSPEIEYLINSRTGYIVETHTVKAMSEVVNEYLNNKEIQNQMKLNIRIMIENTCSINNFIKRFKDTRDYVLMNN